MSRQAWGLLLALSVLWGGSFLFIGIAGRELPPLTLVVVRLVLAAAMLHAALPALGIALPRERRVWAAFAGMGLLNNALPFVLIAWGQQRIPSGLASILNATTPLWTVLVAHALTQDERLTRMKAVGVLAGLGGAAVMVGPSALGGLGREAWAELAVLAAAISYGFANVFARRFRAMALQPLAVATGQVMASALMLLPLALLIDRPWTLTAPHAETWASVVGLSLLCTALAYWLFYRILAMAGATNVALVTFLVPISAVLLGAVVLHETLLVRHFAGMALIGIGLLFIDGRLPRRLFAPTLPSQLDERR